MTVDVLVPIDGNRVTVSSNGFGQPIVVLPGTPPAGSELRASLGDLADVARIIHFRSSSFDELASLETQLQQATAELEHVRAALGLGDIIVLGHAEGVAVALEYTRRWPAHVAGLILCLAGVDIADPLAEIDAPALVVASTHAIEIADLVRAWLSSEQPQRPARQAFDKCLPSPDEDHDGR